MSLRKSPTGVRHALGAIAAAIALTLLALAAPSPGATSSVSLAASRLAAGKFLVAKRSLWDPNFSHTVVLLLEHGPQGAMGLVVNRPSEMKLSALLPEIELGERPDVLYQGGPVALGHVFVLIRSERELEEARHVFDDIYVSGSRGLLERLLGDGIPEERLRVYAGHAGWAPGQLEHEVARDDWLVVGASAETVFNQAPSEVWPRLIKRESEMLAALRRP